jgi:hypothetical protein
MERDEIGFLKGQREGFASRAKTIHMHAPFLDRFLQTTKNLRSIPRIFLSFAGGNHACDLENEAEFNPTITLLGNILSALVGRALP